ncbi:MAG: hypothetical protein H6760_00400 [Candidatus Nomurabacteria bacterium]|nr:MAG: hypothetical protein H6760_00400 [Candidatus Nomurabacteria bacterium]
MESTQSTTFTSKLLRRKGVVSIVVLLALAMSYGVLLTQPFLYQARVELLIIQQQSENQDLLSALRATEQVGKGLVDVISTSSFFDKVLATDFPITDDFGTNPEERRLAWQKTAHASISQQSGILTVTVLHKNKEQAAVIARGVAQVLTTESQEFHGKANIIVKVVDDVYTKQWPVQPNILGTTVAALFFGIIAGVGIVALLPLPKAKEAAPAIRRTENDMSGAAPSARKTLHEIRMKSTPPPSLPGIDEEEDDL